MMTDSHDKQEENSRSNMRTGRMGERLAEEYLVTKGYAILERRYRRGASHREIDLIAQTGTTIVFVEVKTRTDRYMDPAEAVDLKKQRFMASVANSYMRGLNYDMEYRFDIIAITGTEEDYTLEHYEDAFLPPLTSR